MCPLLSFLVCFPLPPEPEGRPAAPASPRHVMIYHERGRFAGWPANHGIWSWGDEILVGFSAGTYKELGPTGTPSTAKSPNSTCWREAGVTMQLN